MALLGHLRASTSGVAAAEANSEESRGDGGVAMAASRGEESK
jgi:hypothetical protein